VTEFKECQECYGVCCTAYSLTPLRTGEAARIAAYLDMTEADFRERYLWKPRYVANDREMEAITPANPCPFWQMGQCAIHEVKPETCANYGPGDKTLEECAEYHKYRMRHDETGRSTA
jgi:Fe-S-cluster containining protein